MSQLVDTISTRLDGEKIPGIGRIREEAAEIRPGMPYPSVGLGEDYIETPSTTKRGFIVPVTREAVFFDRTHLVLQRAAEVGEILGLNKEKRLLDLIIGVDNNYKWKGTQYNTYYAAGDAGPWVNVLAHELVDWTDVDAAEQLFADILDPNTGEPVLIQASTLLVMPAYRHAAARILSATETQLRRRRRQSLDGPTPTRTAGAASSTRAGWPIGGSSRRDRFRPPHGSGGSSAISERPSPTWRTGPLPFTQSPANSEADFNQDIVIRFKASERGAAAVINPRYVVKSTGTGSGE